MSVCTDGLDSTYDKDHPLGSPSYQQSTASFRVDKLRPANDPDISATTVPYIVIAKNHPQVDDRKRDYGVIIDHSTGKYVHAIVAETGPDNKYNEISLKAAWDLGYPVAVANGKWAPAGDFEFIIFKGTRTLIFESSEAQILSAINTEVPKYF